MRKPRAPLVVLLCLLLAVTLPAQAAAKGTRLIRDAEIENIIQVYATPLFQAAGLNPSAIQVYLVDDPSLNAFVTSGLRMFLHTGLLMRAEDPLEVIGVIAHETGHLAAGHTATRGDSVDKANATVIASYILGLAAALATGRPEAGQAVMMGGQDIALKGLLRYSRSQESAADQAAIRLLNGTGQSPSGLLSFMHVLQDQEVLFAANQDPYLRTHPLTQERIRFLEREVEQSPHQGERPSPELQRLHERMRAKLIGFLKPQNLVLREYPESDRSLPARYARAIAHFRASELDPALEILDGLLEERPDDPFFHDLEGQMLFENGRIAEAVEAYRTALELLPNSAQIRLSLGRALIELNQPSSTEEALDHITRTLHQEPENAFAWRLAAIGYGRQGDIGMTALSLAEAALARGRSEEAREQAQRAQKLLPEGSPSWLRASDVEQVARRRLEDKN